MTLITTATDAQRADVQFLLLDAGLPTAGLADAQTLIVAVDDGKVVGSVAVERHQDEAGTAYLLRSLAVRPEVRRAGLGQQLVAAALSTVEPGQRVGLLTDTAADFFRRLQFDPVAWDELPTALNQSAELSVVCSTTAQAMLRVLD